MIVLKDYIPMINFLSSFLMSEVVLFDREKIVYIVNPLHPSRRAGAKISEMEYQFIENKEYETQDFIVNYRALSLTRDRLRSATFFIKDQNNKLHGMLSINLNVTDLIAARNTVNHFINGPVTDEEKKQQHDLSFLQVFNGSVREMMETVISSIAEKSSIPPERLSQEEKIKIVKDLDDKGTFLIKGSVNEVAKALKTSEATIYRYLNQL